MEKIRKHFIFHGYVQGVGFRFRAYRAAESRGITGWVRNCYDGTVEMEAEGNPRDIEDMLVALEKNQWASIESISAREIPLQDSSCFSIRDY